MIYGIRVRTNKVSGPWKRVRTRRNPKGTWRKAGALFILGVLKVRGYKGHIYEIANYPTETHYSRNFRREELECKCGCSPSSKVVANLTELARGLEHMRSESGHPIRVLSGHRCKAYNKKIGGATRSQHIQGTAADIDTMGGKRQELYYNAANKVPMFRDGGIGKYPNGGLHVDHRSGRARWSSY